MNTAVPSTKLFSCPVANHAYHFIYHFVYLTTQVFTGEGVITIHMEKLLEEGDTFPVLTRANPNVR